MSLHLHAVADAAIGPDTEIAGKLAPSFFVIRRDNGQWSGAAKIMAVHDSEIEAQTDAARLKAQFPNITFGVARLISEARTTSNPVEIVRAE